jgi:hypothetical protein
MLLSMPRGSFAKATARTSRRLTQGLTHRLLYLPQNPGSPTSRSFDYSYLIHKTPEPYIVHQPQHDKNRQNV